MRKLGRKEEAKEYALGEKDEEKRDGLLELCLEGEEKRALSQKLADQALGRLIHYLPYTVVGGTEKYEAVEKILQILFPDGNLLLYHNILQYNCLYRAFALCDQGRYDEVIPVLRQSREHAREMTRLSGKSRYRYTSPYFDLLEGEKPISDSDRTDLDDFADCLKNNRCFDPIRDREEFKSLLS